MNSYSVYVRTKVRQQHLAGSIRAPYALRNLYLIGQGMKRDYSAARKWLNVAAQKRHLQARILLGSMYFKGLGTGPQYDEAVRCFQSSTDGQGQLHFGMHV